MKRLFAAIELMDEETEKTIEELEEAIRTIEKCCNKLREIKIEIKEEPTAMTRKTFIPEEGKTYRNEGGGDFQCIKLMTDGGCANAIMRSVISGWQLEAHGIGIYEDGSIDWDFSTGGHFVD